MIYFDNSATTATTPEVAETISKYMLQDYANPSSLHSAGQSVRADLLKARKNIARYLNCHPKELIFMASGTEADNFALIQGARMRRERGRHIITSSVEHKAVLNSCKYLENEGYEVTYLPVDSAGRISMDALAAAVRADTVLVSLIFANNELGTLAPIREMASFVRSKGIIFHTDAVQAVGKLPIDMDDLSVDMLTFSAHKIHAPKGIAALYVREELRAELSPLIHGGGQEGGLRGGTENVPYIMGLAKACELLDGHEGYILSLRDSFEKALLQKIPDIRINGDIEKRVCSISNITFTGIDAELLIGYIPELCFSLGSACTSGDDAPSHVLTAAGMSAADAKSTARFSFSRYNTMDEVLRASDLLADAVKKLRH